MNEVRTSIPDVPRRLVKIGLWFTLALPLAWVVWKYLSDVSANPAQELNHSFGRMGFYLLALNITIGSALAFLKIAGKKLPRTLLPILAYRRHLGVAGVLYLAAHVSLHFLIEAGITEGFEAIVKAKYLWAGSAAFLGLLILAFTSNNRSMKWLGKRWKTLHRAVYPLFFIATAHTLMIEKADIMHFGFLATLVSLPLLARISRHLLKSRTALSSAR